MQADIFRVFYLNALGGVWIDADEEYRPINSDMQMDYLFQKESLRFLNFLNIEVTNSFIAMALNHPILLDVIGSLDFEECKNEKLVWWNTGPGAFTLQIAKRYAEAKLNKPDAEVSRLHMIHSFAYQRYFRSPEMEYKKTNLSWQKNIVMNSG
jgi:mannosyltransferase OCH1-like enzyme